MKDDDANIEAKLDAGFTRIEQPRGKAKGEAFGVDLAKLKAKVVADEKGKASLKKSAKKGGRS